MVLNNFEIPPLPQMNTINPCTDTSPSNSHPDPNKIPPLKELISHELYEASKQLAYEYKATLLCNHVMDLGG